jgi:hypothetical protein
MRELGEEDPVKESSVSTSEIQQSIHPVPQAISAILKFSLRPSWMDGCRVIAER